MEALDQIVARFKQEGKKAQETAEYLNENGFKLKDGRKYDVSHVYNKIADLRRKGQLNSKGEPALNLIPRKRKPTMLTIPVEEKPESKGKVIAVIADFEDVQRLINGWIR